MSDYPDFPSPGTIGLYGGPLDGGTTPNPTQEFVSIPYGGEDRATVGVALYKVVVKARETGSPLVYGVFVRDDPPA